MRKAHPERHAFIGRLAKPFTFEELDAVLRRAFANAPPRASAVTHTCRHRARGPRRTPSYLARWPGAD